MCGLTGNLIKVRINVSLSTEEQIKVSVWMEDQPVSVPRPAVMRPEHLPFSRRAENFNLLCKTHKYIMCEFYIQFQFFY